MPTTAQVGFSFMPGEFAQKICFVIFNLKLLAIGCTCVGVSAFQLKQLGKVEHLVAALIAYVEVNNHIKTNTFRFNSTPTTVPETPYNVPENVRFPSRPMPAYANLSVQQSHLASNVSNLPTAFNPNATVQYNQDTTGANATSALSYTVPPASLMGATEAERIDARMLTKYRIASPISSTTASTAFHKQTVPHARNTISLHTREARWKNVSLGDNSTVTPIAKVPINFSEAMPLAVNQQSKSQSNLTLSAGPSIAATTEQRVQKLNNREKSSLANDNLPPAVIEVATEINASNANGEPTSSSTKEMLQRKAGSVTSTTRANGVQVTNIHKLVTATISRDASTKRETISLVTSPKPLISADTFGTSFTFSSTTFAFATVNIPPQTKDSPTRDVYRDNQTTFGTSTTVSLQQDYGESLVPHENQHTQDAESPKTKDSTEDKPLLYNKSYAKIYVAKRKDSELSTEDLQKVPKSREIEESRSSMNDLTSEAEQLTGNKRPSVPESTEDKDSEDSVTDGNREVLRRKGNAEQYNPTDVIEVNVDELLTSPSYSANVTDSPVIRVDNISTIFATSSLSLTSFSSSTFSTVPLFPSSSVSSTSAANSTVSKSSVTSPSSVTFPSSATSPSATDPPSSLTFLSSATFLSSPSPPSTVTSQSSAAFLSSLSPPSTMTSQSSAASPSSVTFASSAISPSSTISPSFATFPSSETYSSAAPPTSSLTFLSFATSPYSTTTPSFATSTSSAMFSSSPFSTTSKNSPSPTLFISPTFSPSSPPSTLPSSSKSYPSSSTSVTSPAFTIIMSLTPTNVTSFTPSTWATASTTIPVVVTTETPKLATETRDGLPASTSANERPATVTKATMEAKTITKAPSKRRTPNWSNVAALSGYAQEPFHRRKRADEHHAFVAMVANIVYGSLYTSLAAGIVLIFSSLTGFCGGLCKVIVCLKISIIGGLVIIIFELGAAGIVIYAYDAIVNGPEHSVLRKAFNLLCQSANFCMNPTVLVLMGVFFCIAIVVQIASLTLSYRIVQDASKPEQEEMFSYPAIPNYPILMSDLNRHPMAPHQSRIGRGRMEQMGGMYSMGGMMPNQMIQNPMMANFPNPNMAYTTPMVPTAPQPQAQPVTVFQPTMSVVALQPASVPMCCHSHSHSHSHQHVTQAPSCHQCRSYSIITI